MQRYSTSTLPEADKFAYWKTLHRRLSPALEVIPLSSQSFDAECTAQRLGALVVRQIYSAPARLEVPREKVHAKGTQPHYLVRPVEGSLRIRHNGIDDTVAAGSFVLIDSSLPCLVEFTEPNLSVGVDIPADLLAFHLPGGGQLAGIPVPGDRGIGHVASTMLWTIASKLERGLPPETGERLAHSLLDVVATSYVSNELVGTHGVTLVKLQRIRARRFIEANLQDPILSPASIADSMQVPTKYLRTVFEREGEHLTAYIQRRRLERCAEHLRTDGAAHHSLQQIAVANGFRDAARFSRAFRQHFGMSARNYRATAGVTALDGRLIESES